MTDTHEKLMEQARSIAYEANECCARMDGYEEGIRDLAFKALSQAHQDGIREGKRQAAGIVRTGGKYPVTREGLATAILSTITDESE